MNTSVSEQIKSRLPITEVLSTYLTLQQAGSQYKAKCPFHNERTASFSISPERGVYYCFGCGVKGDIFDFVQHFEGVDFKGALKILADRAGIVLGARDTTVEDVDGVYDALEVATKKYQAALAHNPEALAYLKARGITEETIEQFRLGYAPNEWRTIASMCTQDELSSYERAGLIKKTDKGYYDRFRGRIMFPMNDSSGRVVAFSGRMFPDTPEGPKYLNSPETEVFHKSRILYGFDKAKLHIKRHNFAILVEGQMDMVLSHQHGFKNTIATSGTAVSDASIGDSGAQLSVLARLTPNLFLAFDGDSAGEKALSRAALVALALGLNPKVVPLPEGVDPADFLSTHTQDEWKDLLKISQHFILHKLATIRTQATSAHALVRAMREQIFPYLVRIASPIESKLYIESIAKELGIGVEEVVRELALFRTAQPTLAVSAEEVPVAQSSTLSLEARFVALVAWAHSDRVQACSDRLTNVSFDGATIVLPTLSEVELHHALSIVERDYGSLDEDSRVFLADEMAGKIAESFYREQSTIYATELRRAESAQDEVLTATLLNKLQQLQQRRRTP